MTDPARVALIGPEVAHVVHTPRGAWPTGVYSAYEPDIEHLSGDYLMAANGGEEAFAAYLRKFVFDRNAGVMSR